MARQASEAMVQAAMAVLPDECLVRRVLNAALNVKSEPPVAWKFVCEFKLNPIDKKTAEQLAFVAASARKIKSQGESDPLPALAGIEASQVRSDQSSPTEQEGA